MRDPDIRRRLERLRPPERRPGFEDELWERIAARDRAVARRWRRAAVALAALAAAAFAATALVATASGSGATLDRTVSCRVDSPSGIPVIASPRGSGAGSGVLQVGGDGAVLLRVADGVTGFELDGASCRTADAALPLGQAGLSLAGGYAAGNAGGFSVRCFVSGRVLLRLRLVLDGDGAPRQAKVALAGPGGTPVAFVRWSPGLALAYVSPACPAG